MPNDPPCGPPCEYGAFDSSDPTCNMPFIPRIVHRIIEDCKVNKAPDAIFEIPLPEFPLPPNLGFQCSTLYPVGKESTPYEDYDAQSRFFKPGEPRVAGTPKEPKIDVTTSTPVDPDAGACDFALEVNVPCISIYPSGKEPNFEDPAKESQFTLPSQASVPKVDVVLTEPENIDKSLCDFNIKVDVPCISVYPSGKELNFEDINKESQFILPDGLAVPKIQVNTAAPDNPNKSPCDFNIQVDVPCVTISPAGKELTYENINLESRLILPVIGRESIVDVNLVAPLSPVRSPCDFNIKVDVPCITVYPAGAVPNNPATKSKIEVVDPNLLDDPEIIVRIEPSARPEKGTCDFDIGVDLRVPDGFFCVDLNIGTETVIAPAPEVCAAHPVLLPGYSDAQRAIYYQDLQEYAECWWKPVDTARAAEDYTAFLIAFNDYEAALPGQEVYLIPDYYESMPNAIDISRRNISNAAYVDPDFLKKPVLSSRVENSPDGGCAFIIATDLILPDPCARILTGKGDILNPGFAPFDPGPLPAYPTESQKQTHADYWWHPAQSARYLRDTPTLASSISIFESQVPEANRYLIPDYYPNLGENASYDKPQTSSAKFLPGLKNPKLATHVAKEDPDDCSFNVNTDLVIPCVGVAPAGADNDCPDPGLQPVNPGAAPDPITLLWRTEHAEYWWWAVAKAQFDKDEEAFDDALEDYEDNVIAGDRYLVSGYSIHLWNSINKLACQDSTIEVVPAEEPAVAYVRVEQVSEDSCDFRIGLDLKIPIPDITVNVDAVISPSPFKGYLQEDIGGDPADDKVKAENGCITILLDNGRTQTFEIPASTQQVAVGDQLIVKAYIKDGAVFDDILGYQAVDVIVEYRTEASDLAVAWEKSQQPLPAPAAQPEIVVPLGGIAKDGGMIVGFMVLNAALDKIWTQVLNECITIDGRHSSPVNFRANKIENGGAFVPPNVNVPTLKLSQGAVLITFRDGQNKPWAFKVDTPAVVSPGDTVLLDIEFTDDAYVAVPDNGKPGGIRYDFDKDEVTITCVIAPLVNNDDVNAIPTEVTGTPNTVAIIGIYHPTNLNNWPALNSPHWVQKFEGMFTFPAPKPLIPIPAPLAPGTVLTSAGATQQPYWDFPRYL